MNNLTSQEFFLFCFAGAWAISACLGWIFLVRPERAKRLALVTKMIPASCPTCGGQAHKGVHLPRPCSSDGHSWEPTPTGDGLRCLLCGDTHMFGSGKYERLGF